MPRCRLRWSGGSQAGHAVGRTSPWGRSGDSAAPEDGPRTRRPFDEGRAAETHTAGRDWMTSSLNNSPRGFNVNLTNLNDSVPIFGSGSKRAELPVCTTASVERRSFSATSCVRVSDCVRVSERRTFRHSPKKPVRLMRDTDAPASVSSSAPPTTGRPARYAVRMPIDGDVDSLEAAVEKLLVCDSNELRRARRHHRRALSALENGSYDTLSAHKRSELVRRLRADLEALDRAIHRAGSASSDDRSDRHSTPAAGASTSGSQESGPTSTGSGWSLPIWR